MCRTQKGRARTKEDEVCFSVSGRGSGRPIGMPTGRSAGPHEVSQKS
jgi:hypothetical protein